MKRWCERLVAYLDMKPSRYWVQEEQLEGYLGTSATDHSQANKSQLNMDLDDGGGAGLVKITVKERRSVIAGWVSLFAFALFIAASIYVTLMYTDPRNNMLVPHMESSKSHLEYRYTPHQALFRIQALVKNCMPSACATHAEAFSVHPSDIISDDGVDCHYEQHGGANFCRLAWTTRPITLYDRKLDIRTLSQKLKFDMNPIGNISVYLISSAVTFDSNFHKHNINADDIMTYAKYQMKSEVSNYLYRSYIQCFDTLHRTDDIGVSGLFSRIHYSPVSYLFDRKLHKEIIAQGVFWSEMKYPALNPVEHKRTIEIAIEESDLAWYYETPGVTSLLIQIVVMASAAVALPPVMKRALRMITKKLTMSAKGMWLTFFISCIPIVVVIASIVIFATLHPEKSSPELFNTLTVLLIFFGTMVVIILIRLCYALYKSCCPGREPKNYDAPDRFSINK